MKPEKDIDEQLLRMSKREAKERAVCLKCPFPACFYDYGKECKLLSKKRDEKYTHTIEQYTIGGKLVKRWASIVECAMALGISAQEMRTIARKKDNVLNGYEWRYVTL